MQTLNMPHGAALPQLGLGTWHMGEAAARRGAEVAAVRSAIAMGYRLIDTAEMYGDGGAEQVVGQAIADALRAGDVRRDELFVVSKVLPHNASRRGTQAACERSLARLGLDRIDLYLLHWRGPHRLADTREALQALVQQGRIGAWGVSNFDTGDMEELAALGPAGGAQCAANQVYYSLGERGPEFSLLPWQRAHGLPLMAYSPIDQGALAASPKLDAIAARRGGARPGCRWRWRGYWPKAVWWRFRRRCARRICAKTWRRLTCGSNPAIWPNSIACTRRRGASRRSR